MTDVDEETLDPVVTKVESPPTGKSRVVVIVLAALLVGALVAVFLLYRQLGPLKDDQRVADAESEATVVAEDVIVRMTTYDYSTIDKDFSWVDEVGTDEFGKDQEVVTNQLLPIIKKTKAHAEGTVQGSAATATDEDHVTVLLFVDQELGREGSKETSLDRTRVQMDMTRVGSQWLVEDIQLL